MTKKIEEAKKDTDDAVEKANDKKSQVQDKAKENTKKACEDATCKKGDANVETLAEELSGIKKRVDDFLKTQGPEEEKAKEEKKKAQEEIKENAKKAEKKQNMHRRSMQEARATRKVVCEPQEAPRPTSRL